MRLFCVLAVIAAMAGGLIGCALGGSSDIRQMIQETQSRAFPAIVFIKPTREQLGTGVLTRELVFGSGVIISPDGLVVTNSHVAKSASEINCVLFNSELIPAEVVGLDEDTDIALLQLKLPAGHAPLPTMEFSDSDNLQAGEFVMAFGSPFGLSRSVSMGIVSSPRRYLDIGAYSTWIQTDTAINPGNSGGPLVDDSGRIVGINTLRLSRGDNVGFAIPSNTVQQIVRELREHGRVERSYSGIQLQPLRDFTRDVIIPGERGTLVGGVDVLSPAAEAGLKVGDLILRVNGKAMDGVYQEDIPTLRARLTALPPKAAARFDIRRGNEDITVNVVPILKQELDTDGLELAMWNCSVQEISKFKTPTLAYFVPNGVYVLGVRESGNAYQSGLRAGDIILSVDKVEITSVESLQEMYRRLSRLDKGKRTALLEILRAGYRQFVALDFNRDQQD